MDLIVNFSFIWITNEKSNPVWLDPSCWVLFQYANPINTPRWNDRFHVVSTWNSRDMFVGQICFSSSENAIYSIAFRNLFRQIIST